MTSVFNQALAARLSCVAIFCLALTFAQVALAQDGQETTQESNSSKWGVGFQSSWPAWGISGIYDVNELVSAQVVLGAFGSLTVLSGRILYRFNRREAYDLYGFGTLGVWRYTSDVFFFDRGLIRQTETVLGLGGGGGIELNWQKILASSTDSFPPLYSTVDLGLGYANFDVYNFSSLWLGVGIHYRF